VPGSGGSRATPDQGAGSDYYKDAADNHVDHMFWLPRAAIDRIRNGGAGGGGLADQGLFAVETLQEQRDAGDDEDDTDDVFHDEREQGFCSLDGNLRNRAR
jgi:hypothetical protein